MTRLASHLESTTPAPRIAARCRGTSLIEAAIVLPLLMLLLFGLLEYGWLFLKTQAITDAARQGARQAVLPDSSTADVEAHVDALMQAAQLGDSGYSLVIDPLDVSTAEPGDAVTVRVTVSYANIRLVSGSLVPVPVTVGGEVTMAKEGPQ